jgi:tRNA nucleotidyltransferase (CCA-adding enzyme)
MREGIGPLPSTIASSRRWRARAARISRGRPPAACYDPLVGPVVPSGVRRLLEVLRDAGGRPYLVGGAVRDALLGRPLDTKDVDIEVFGLPLPQLKEALSRVGRVDAVGEAFTVLKVSGLEGVDGAVDVALPRRDSKAGAGHRGIAVIGDPDLTVE